MKLKLLFIAGVAVLAVQQNIVIPGSSYIIVPNSAWMTRGTGLSLSSSFCDHCMLFQTKKQTQKRRRCRRSSSIGYWMQKPIPPSSFLFSKSLSSNFYIPLPYTSTTTATYASGNDDVIIDVDSDDHHENNDDYYSYDDDIEQLQRKEKLSNTNNNSSNNNNNSNNNNKSDNNNNNKSDTKEDNDTMMYKKMIERHKYWIVLVDDEESIRAAVGDYLYDSGYQVTACADSDAVVQVLTNPLYNNNNNYNNNYNDLESNTNNNDDWNPQGRITKQKQHIRIPDALIIDIRMPESTMDGLELLQWIRSNHDGVDDNSTKNNKKKNSTNNNMYINNNNKEVDTNKLIQVLSLSNQRKLQTVPVVLLTARGLTKDRIIGYQAGANVYLSKPFYPDELLAVVDNMIVRKKQNMYAVVDVSTTTTSHPSSSLEESVSSSLSSTGTSSSNGSSTRASTSKTTATTRTGTILRSDSLLVEMKEDMDRIKKRLEETTKHVVRETDIYLTLAERDVLFYISLGYTNHEIASIRNTINHGGVTRIINNLYRKTNTVTRTELVRWGIETGYIPKNNKHTKR